ncbi:hypothetical protein DFJ73DRAFT_832505, partial [Zopfochytrium polystomum]
MSILTSGGVQALRLVVVHGKYHGGGAGGGRFLFLLGMLVQRALATRLHETGVRVHVHLSTVRSPKVYGSMVGRDGMELSVDP